MGAKPRRRSGQTVTCAWCRRSFPLLTTGRLPQYCGNTCRHLAWEHRQALASKRNAVEIVIHTVEVERPSSSELTIRRNGPGWVARSRSWFTTSTVAASTTGTCQCWPGASAGPPVPRARPAWSRRLR